MTNWEKITDLQARQHPLYGVKGWAIVLLIYLVLKLPLQLPTGITTNNLLLIFFPFQLLWVVLIPVLGLTAWNAYIIYLVCTKNHRLEKAIKGFLAVDLLIYLTYGVVTLEYSPASHAYPMDYFPVLFNFPAQRYITLAMYLLLNGGLLAYVLKSKRMRVTCKSEVRRDDPYFVQLNLSSSTEDQSGKLHNLVKESLGPDDDLASHMVQKQVDID